MKELRFKIVELETHQVLAIKDFDEEDNNSPCLVVTLYFNGLKIRQSFGYDSEEARDEMFDLFDHEMAQNILDGMVEMFSESY